MSLDPLYNICALCNKTSNILPNQTKLREREKESALGERLEGGWVKSSTAAGDLLSIKGDLHSYNMTMRRHEKTWEVKLMFGVHWSPLQDSGDQSMLIRGNIFTRELEAC